MTNEKFLTWNIKTKPVNIDELANTRMDVTLTIMFDTLEPILPDVEPTLKKAVKRLRTDTDSELSDIKILCDGKVFPCHKLILSLRSEVFKRMFQSDLKISNTEDESTLKIEDISAEIMERFLQFIYTDELTPKDINRDLLVAADRYDVKRLVNVCVNHFESIIDTQNAMEIALTAYMVEHEHLLQKASQFLINNAGAIKKPERWDQIKTTHPQIAIKVMDLIVFEKQPLK